MTADAPVPASRTAFDAALAPVFARLSGADPADGELAGRLNADLPLTGPEVAAVRSAAEAGVADGWLCDRAMGGISFSRPLKPSDATAGLSVDAVVMDDVAGPKHTHPNGEINLCFATKGDPKFCGHGAGWVVFEPGSTHIPVVREGAMLILYFLPGGAIQFHRS